jgi:hypothetical protein
MECGLWRSTVWLTKGPAPSPSSLGGVLEPGGFLAARLVQDLRLVLIRIARGLDGPLRVGYQLTDNRYEALTFSPDP